MSTLASKKIEQFLAPLEVLIVDNNTHSRKLLRTQLTSLGVRSVRDANDGVAGLESIRSHVPDVVLIEWDLPILTGPEMVRMIRKPDGFPYPDLPVIMMTAKPERWRVLESQRIGAHEFIAKPMSGKVLIEKIMAIFVRPRRFIRENGYYGPEQRQMLRGSTPPIHA